MQHQTLSRAEDGLSFETVVPKATSTRHVAASAFYHCLGECPFRDRVVRLRHELRTD